jgi:hypothetical protein
MKTLMMLAASFAVMTASSAFAQSNTDTCHSSMIPCLDLCSQRPSKGLQDSCTKTCEQNANACYSQLYGTPSGSREMTPRDALNSAAPDTSKKSKTSR